MSDAALAAGYAEFGNVFLKELSEHPDKPWRTAGRKTKAMPNGEDKDWWGEAGLTMVKAYHDWRLANPNINIWETPQGVPAIELQIGITLEDGTFVKGYIDRVYQDFDSGELLIGDLKTGKTTPPPIQLAVYALGLEQTFGIRPKFGGYWMAREGTLSTPVDLDKFSSKMISRWLRDVNKALSMGIYVPHVGMNCSWCGVQDQCYVWTDGAYTPDFDSDLNMAQGSNNE